MRIGKRKILCCLSFFSATKSSFRAVYKHFVRVDGTFQNRIFQNQLFGQTKPESFRMESFRRNLSETIFSQTGIFQNGIIQKESFRKYF
jgi:hypothetical protein